MVRSVWRQLLVGTLVPLLMSVAMPQSLSACANAGTCGPVGHSCEGICYQDLTEWSWYDVDCPPYNLNPSSCVDFDYDFYSQYPPMVKNDIERLKDRVAGVFALSAQDWGPWCDYWCDWGWCEACQPLNA